MAPFDDAGDKNESTRCSVNPHRPYVRNLDAMVSFYTKLRGMVVTDTGELRGNRITFMSRNANEHHQLVMVSGRPSDEFSPVNQMELRDLRPSNHGNAWSIYFLDIEGNRIEIYTGSPWYVNQPYQQPLDLDASSDDIRASTKSLVMQDSSFTPHETWQQSLKERLSA